MAARGEDITLEAARGEDITLEAARRNLLFTTLFRHVAVWATPASVLPPLFHRLVVYVSSRRWGGIPQQAGRPVGGLLLLGYRQQKHSLAALSLYRRGNCTKNR